MTASKRPGRPQIHPVRRTIRYWLSRTLVSIITRGWVRVEFVGREQLPDGPAIYAFNHLSWVDPFVMMATMPYRPRLSFFGPREEDMLVGGRNRLMSWTGATIPYKPGKNDLLEATRRVGAVIAGGGVVAIAGEGRIGAIEDRLLPLNDGPAYFALRSRVPLVPIAINGTSWLRFGARVRVQVGEPIAPEGRPDRATVDAMTATLRDRLEALLAGAPTPERTGRVARWVSDRFNEWPEGSREAALAAQLGQGDGPEAAPAA
jgi:1-acyl-sn-glycerol-3-phosphate acyltransferase